MPGFIGMPELILLGIVTLLIFGPKRLPEMGRSLGRGLREFKDSVTNDRPDADAKSAADAKTAADTTPVATLAAAPAPTADGQVAEEAERTPEHATA